MGWFWATQAPPAGPARTSPDRSSPPAGCPMHSKSGTLPNASQQAPTPAPPSISNQSCPYTPEEQAPSSRPAEASSALSKLNPLNYMPSSISQAMSPSQKYRLPTTRETSSIPRGTKDDEGNWEYPSPQQMYNAMLRKGYTDTDETAVESMVDVHNFLNEGAWGEIVEWERRFSKGLLTGWQLSQKGEEGSMAGAMIGTNAQNVAQPRLIRFMGRPRDVTPKAYMLQVLGRLYPSKFGGEPPFDRHDWFVQRQNENGSSQEVRYVIDYYSGPDEPTGEPVFYLDVRPAVDGPTAAAARMIRWGGDVWWRAKGRDIRQESS